jgi:hypothetical protein
MPGYPGIFLEWSHICFDRGIGFSLQAVTDSEYDQNQDDTQGNEKTPLEKLVERRDSSEFKNANDECSNRAE